MRTHCQAKKMCRPVVSVADRPAPEYVSSCKVFEHCLMNDDSSAHASAFMATSATSAEGSAGTSAGDLLHIMTRRIEELTQQLAQQNEHHSKTQERMQHIEQQNEELQRIVQQQSFALASIAPHHTTHNTTNTTTNTTHNNYNINITLRDFGDEDTSYISDERVQELFMQCTPGFIAFTKEVYFNPEQPQNSTIKIASKKQDLANVRKDGEWTLVRIGECVDKAVNNSRSLMLRRLPANLWERMQEESPDIADWQLRVMAKHASVWRPFTNAVKCALLQKYKDECRQAVLTQH